METEEAIKEMLKSAHEKIKKLNAKVVELETELDGAFKENSRVMGIAEDLAEADSMGELDKIVRQHGLDFGDNNGN